MNVSFVFKFCRKVFMEVRCLQRCPFTFWTYTSESCHCDYRLGFFKLVIEDYIKFFNYEEFDDIEANTTFEGVYSQFSDAYLIIQNNH